MEKEKGKEEMQQKVWPFFKIRDLKREVPPGAGGLPAAVWRLVL